MSRENFSLGEARRIALAAQGFDRPRPNRRVSERDLASTIRRMGLLQIDYVNVLAPAQYQVLFSRLGPYERSLLDDQIYRGREFTEQWAHEASIVPVETWPLLRHRMETHRVRPYGFEKFMVRSPGYVEHVLDEVGARGPLTADDLADPEDVPRKMAGDAWIGTVPRAVLEAHFGRGLLAVTERRSNFARVFDLAERVLPLQHHGRRVDREDAQRELLRLAARSCGIATADDLADYYRIPVREARPRIVELVESGELREVRVAGWRAPCYLYREARMPRRIAAATLLSPFDPVVWYRPRTARLFEFEYRIEIYVPAEKRRWGYYCLPFLLDDRLVGRVDLKADRAGRRLLVLAAYVELHHDPGVVAKALARELQTMARWLGLDSVAVERKGNLARELKAAL